MQASKHFPFTNVEILRSNFEFFVEGSFLMYITFDIENGFGYASSVNFFQQPMFY